MGRKLSAEALAFIQWDISDVDDRDPTTQEAWCEAHGVTNSYPARWRKNPTWLEARAQAVSEQFFDENEDEVAVLLGKGNIEEVVAAAHEAAMKGDVSAMRTYLQYATAWETPDDTNVRGLSDEDLIDALNNAAAEVMERLALP